MLAVVGPVGLHRQLCDCVRTGLMHAAVLLGNTRAAVALGWRYSRGIGVVTDIELATWYYGGALATSFLVVRDGSLSRL